MGTHSKSEVTNSRKNSLSGKMSRSLLDSVPSLVAFVDPHMRFHYANPAFRNWLGLRKESIQKKTFQEVFSNSVFAQIAPCVDSVLGGNEVKLEVTFSGDQDFRVLKVTLSPQLSTPKGFTFCGIDITGEKKAKQLNELLELLPAAVYTCDKDGSIKLFNKAASDLWGRSPEIGKDKWCGSWKIFNPEDGSRVALETCPMAVALKEGRAVVGEEIIIERPDGSKRNIAPNPMPILDASGKVVGALNMLIDITDRKLAAEALKQSEERFRMMADLVPIVIWLSDESGNCTYLNPHWTQLTGKKATEGFRNGWLDFIHPDEKSNAESRWNKVARERKAFDLKFRYLNAKGDYSIHHAMANPRYNDAGKFLGHIGIMHDVTRHEVLRSFLLEEVKARTEELEQKNVTLEKMNQDLASFAYISSHDLQEPLRKIQTFSSRILELDSHKFSETSKDYFSRIQNSVNRMRSLIEDLLAYSSSNNSEQEPELTDVNQLMLSVQKDLKELIAEKKAVLEISKMPKLSIIPFQFEQLVFNIITNSLKFSKEETPLNISIRADIVPGNKISSTEADIDETYHHISFTDNGIGFDPEDKTRIFDVFQRLHTNEEYSGTGIGLAICKKIMLNHRGIIIADAKVDVGATFHVYLPV